MTLPAAIATTMVFTLSVSELQAQVVSPQEFAKTEAPSSIYRGLGSRSTSGWRYLQIHDDLKGKNATVREIAFRRDGARNTLYSSYEFNLTLILSTASKTAATITANFDANHGANKKVVASNQAVNMPATRARGVAADWQYRIKLRTPYVFSGANGGLCWEAQTSLFRGPATTVYFDAAWSRSTNPAMAGAAYGSGCYHTKQRLRATTSVRASVNYTSKLGSLSVSGNYHAPNSFAIVALGFSKTNFGAIPLPFVIPGSTRAYSGACSILASLDILFAGTTNASGTTSVNVPIPVDRQYGGVKLFMQLMSQDKDTPAAIDLVTANGYEVQFVAPYDLAPVSRSYANNSLAATGAVTKNYGIVTAIF